MSLSIADIIKNRRTIHKFIAGETPPVKMITEAIEHAIWAPNHHFTQPWHFHLIGAETRERICQLNATLVAEKKGEKAAEVKLRRWREVPGWLLLSCDISGNELRDQEDYAACCCVAQNLSLYLWEKGIGMKWTTGAVTNNKQFYDLFGLDPQQRRVVGLFWYGYPAEIPLGTRLPLAEILDILP